MSVEQLANKSAILLEWRQPDLNSSVSAIASQHEHYASRTRPGVVGTGINQQENLAAVWVDLADLTNEGQARTYYLLDPSRPDGLVRYDVPRGMRLAFAAARVRDALPVGPWSQRGAGDPALIPDGFTYNNYSLRRDLQSRTGSIALLDRWLGDRYRMPGEIVVRDNQIAALSEAPEFLVKPGDATETTQAADRRARLVPRSEVQTQVDQYGGSAVVQPRLPSVPPRELLEMLGLDKNGPRLDIDTVGLDALNEVTIYSPLWSDAEVVDVKFHNAGPDHQDIGTLYGTWSVPLHMDQLSEAIPDARHAYDLLMTGLRRDYGSLGNLGIKLVLSKTANGDVATHVNGIQLRPFTPDAYIPNDPYRQAFSNTLAQSEISQLITMGDANPVPALVPA